MRQQRSFFRRPGHRRKSQRNTNQYCDSKVHASSPKRFHHDSQIMLMPAKRAHFASSCSSESSTTQNPPCQPQKAPNIFSKKMKWIHGSSANTRTAPPEPPSNLIGATIKDAPASGNSLMSAKFSR